MKIGIFAVIISFLAIESDAIGQTTTNCIGISNYLNCYSHNNDKKIILPNYADSVLDGFEKGRQSRKEREKEKVGRLISSGDCDGALSLALKTGDLDFAKKVKEFCKIL